MLALFFSVGYLVIVDSHSKRIDVAFAQQLPPLRNYNIYLRVWTYQKLLFWIMVPTLNFPRSNGIHHVNTIPYHPAANSWAKRVVQTFKACMKKLSQQLLQDRVNSFFLKYHTTPQSTIGVTPTELFMGRKLHTHLDLLIPDVGERVCNCKRQSLQKYSHDLHAKDRQLQVNDPVLAKNFGTGSQGRF